MYETEEDGLLGAFYVVDFGDSTISCSILECCFLAARSKKVENLLGACFTDFRTEFGSSRTVHGIVYRAAAAERTKGEDTDGE